MIQREVNISPLNTNQSNEQYSGLDVSGIVDTLNQNLAEKLYLNILTEVNVTLRSSKENYIQALSLQGETIILDTADFVVSLVEQGSPSFDMKKGLLASPKVKVAANGEKYIAVPLDKFRGGRYSWRDRETGRFSVGSNPGGSHEFRVVSTKSPSDSWIHPGYEGHHFIDREIEKLDISSEIDNLLGQVL